MSREMTTRQGFVLVAALVAMIIIAFLITGAFFASGQEAGVARAELRDQQALGYAEYALAHALESWSSTARDSMTAAQSFSYVPPSNPPLTSTVFITKLDTALYSVVAEGRVSTVDGAGIRRRVGIVIRTVRDGAAINPPVRVSELAWSELY